MKIINDEPNPWKYHTDKYMGKERIMGQMSPIIWHRDLLVFIWEDDVEPNDPNVHVISKSDMYTAHPRVNASYSLRTGKFIKHGCATHPLTEVQLQKLNEIFGTDVNWKQLVDRWNSCNGPYRLSTRLKPRTFVND